MSEKKYICTAKCPELDYDNSKHCSCSNPEYFYNKYPDGCPCGNFPKWELIQPTEGDEVN